MCYVVHCVGASGNEYLLEKCASFEKAKDIASFALSQNGFKYVYVTSTNPCHPHIIMRLFDDEIDFKDFCGECPIEFRRG